MATASENYGLSTLGSSFTGYYKTINDAYIKNFNKYLMLHYPFFVKQNESLEQRQKNLIDHCFGKLSSPNGKIILDIGSGNGTLSDYLYNTYFPDKIIGIDINEDNLSIAKQIAGERNIEFFKDNAEKMLSIPDRSVDMAICVESAFHYENKNDFLTQLNRVLKEDGQFMIADLIRKSYKKRLLLGKWKRKMYYFHWTEKEYVKGLCDAGFTNYSFEDITNEIIKGYSGYRNWAKDIQNTGFIKYLMFQFINIIQVNINLFLLKYRRKYMVICGVKG
jgi:ubiquinone/menaquinone biosynthesis C-methylase UbiE